MPEPKPDSRRLVLIGVVLGLITLALYLPTVTHEFLDYDDQQYVTENTRVRAGLTSEGLVWAFGYHAGNWHPLTWLSHMLDCELFGLKPGGHHFTNAFLHTLNTLLLFLILTRFTGHVWRGAAVAALFGWHPLHVESVAWVAERKDVLCAFFWLLTIWVYGKYVLARQATVSNGKPANILPGVWYGVTLVCYALALMSKPMAVTLPLVMLLLDYWPLRRTPNFGIKGGNNHGWQTCRGLVLEKLPLLLMSFGACLLTLSAQKLAIVSTKGLPITERISHALVAYVHYLGVTLCPRGLAVYYPYEVGLPVLIVLFAGVLLMVITLLVVRGTGRRPYLATGWFWYLGTLVPVIGLVQVGDQAWADRYTYLPLIGIFICVAWGLEDLFEALNFGSHARNGSQRANLPIVPQTRGASFAILAGVVGVAMLAMTSLQLRHWRNTRTLFEHTSKVTRNNHMAATLLGSLQAREGNFEKAMDYYRMALAYKPNYAEAHFFIGHALDQQGKLDEAMVEYGKALASGPMREQTHIFLGVLLGKKQRNDEAAAHYLEALKLNPDSAVAHNNLARLRQGQGRLQEAREHYAAALKADPGLAQAQNNLGVLLVQQGEVAEGVARLREAARLKPDDLEAQFNLAVALSQQEQWTEAATFFAKTVNSGTKDPIAHLQYARTLVHLGRTREAMSRYASALLIKPDMVEALDRLAWILATSPNPDFRNAAEAVRMAEQACALTAHQDAVKLKTLAAAYAEAGRYEEATATARQAESMADKSDRKELAADCRQMLERFATGTPFREDGSK